MMPLYIHGSHSPIRKALCFFIVLIKRVCANACYFTKIFYQRLFTDADIGNPETADKVGRAAEMAYTAARSANIHLDSHVELALELMGDEWGYYFADHENHVIFWFKYHESIDLMNNVRGVKRKSHVSWYFSCHIS